MGNATGNQSAAIQGVQMGSFLLSLLLSGYLFAALWPNLVALAGFAVVLFAISAWRFRKV